jgi:hypothetical protein
VGHALGHWSRRHGPRAYLEKLETNIACPPQLCRCRRHDGLDQLHQPANQAERALAERHLGTLRRTKQIGDETEIRTLDVGEQQRGSAARYDTSMDLGDFKVGIHLRLHRNEVIVTAKPIEKRAEVGK